MTNFYKSKVYSYNNLLNSDINDKLFNNYHSYNNLPSHKNYTIIKEIEDSTNKPILYTHLKDQYGRVINSGLKSYESCKNKLQHYNEYYKSVNVNDYNNIFSDCNKEKNKDHIINKPYTFNNCINTKLVNLTNNLNNNNNNNNNKSTNPYSTNNLNESSKTNYNKYYFKDKVLSKGTNKDSLPLIKGNINNIYTTVNNNNNNYNNINNTLEINTSYNNFNINRSHIKSAKREYLNDIKCQKTQKEKEKKYNTFINKIEDLKLEIKKLEEQNELDNKYLQSIKNKVKYMNDNNINYDRIFGKMALNVERLVRFKNYLNQLQRLRKKDFVIFGDNMESLLNKIRNDVYNVNYSILKDVLYVKSQEHDVNIFVNELKKHLNEIRYEMNLYKAQQSAEKEFVYDRYTDIMYKMQLKSEEKERINNYVHDLSELNPVVINENIRNKISIIEEEEELNSNIDKAYYKPVNLNNSIDYDLVNYNRCNTNNNNFNNNLDKNNCINNKKELNNFKAKWKKDSENVQGVELYTLNSNHNTYKDIYNSNFDDKYIDTKKINFDLFEKSNLKFDDHELRSKIMKSQSILENLRYNNIY